MKRVLVTGSGGFVGRTLVARLVSLGYEVDLLEEFDARLSPEARFANACDRIIPVLQNYYNEGGTWRAHDVDRAAADQRLSPIDDGAHELWTYVEQILDDAQARGVLRP